MVDICWHLRVKFSSRKNIIFCFIHQYFSQGSKLQGSDNNDNDNYQCFIYAVVEVECAIPTQIITLIIKVNYPVSACRQFGAKSLPK